MNTIKDIKVLLFVGYAIAYPVAVLPPIIIDPLLKSHVIYPSRHYVYAYLCVLIYAFLLAAQFILLKRSKSILSLYFSICVFWIVIIFSMPIFLPEFPNSNLFSVGAATTLLFAFTILIWWLGAQIAIDPASLKSAGHETFEYMKAVVVSIRQGAIAGVPFFTALFFAVLNVEFIYAEASVIDKSDLFLLKMSAGFKVAFYVIIFVVGVVRYFFIMSLQFIFQFKEVAVRLDREAAGKAFMSPYPAPPPTSPPGGRKSPRRNR
jgi:hypothetical protein